MEADQVLEIMDYSWFQRPIFQESPPKSLLHQMHKNEEKSMISEPRKLQLRSYSDRCLAVSLEAGSPTSVIIKPKLQKIPEPCREKREKQRKKKGYSRREKGLSRSLSALESEELRGFLDLGFVFHETNRNLASIVPGLQRRRKSEEGEISRPYLSEAWGDLKWRRKYGHLVMNWKSVKNEMDMKDHLKIWAHAVASTVR